MTVCAWIKIKASALTRRGEIIGNSLEAVGDEQQGWGLQVVYPARSIRFTRGTFSGPETYATTSGGVTAGQWYFAVGTWDGSDVRLYMDSVLVDEAASSHDTSNGAGIKIGFGGIVDEWCWHYGSVDEAAVWSRALTQAEINELYASGVEGAVPGSQVLISDGEGGATWGQVTTAAIEDGTIVDADVATGADIDPLKLEHPGGTSDFLRADGTWAAPPGGGSSPTDSAAWMPLTTVVSSVPELVWDGDNSLIPTYTPI